MEAVQRHGGAAAGQPHRVRHLGDGADLGVLALVLGHEQHALLVTDVDRQGHVHVGEDDDVVERDEQELAHGAFTLLGGFSSFGHTRTNYKNCTGIPAGSRRPAPGPGECLRNAYKPRQRPRSLSSLEPGFPEYRLPGPDTDCGRALRGRDRGHGGRPLAGAHLSFSRAA